jgi:creatinine amidohydrolase
MTRASPAQLCIADAATFWAWRRWPEFSRWPNPESTLVVVPIAGFADWGLDQPLDVAETVLLAVLKAASEARNPLQSLLVTPPLRFVAGPGASAAFAVDVPVAHAFITEVVQSIAGAGFRRVVLFNASPWNEEILSAAVRDLRIGLGVQMFLLQLSGLGLDFHPIRGGDRQKLRALITGLPSADQVSTAIIADVARQVAAMLYEMQLHPPLANQGRISPAQP